jgi:signal transduction histidine kinase
LTASSITRLVKYLRGIIDEINKFSNMASTGYLGTRIHLDVSDEFSSLEDNLNVMIENMDKMSRAKIDFLSRMSHEIRTPMNAIIGMSQIGKVSNEPQRIADCFLKIENNSKHLLGIINDILDYSKIESGKLVLHEELFSLTRNMDFVFSMFNARAQEKGIDLDLAMVNIEHDGIVTDSLRLNQVLINLLSNAIKFTESGGRIKLQVTEVLYLDGEGVYDFFVRDSGIGIDPVQAKGLFTPFAQANSKISSVYGGTGLGLAISKNLVEMMGGNIALESVPGVGSTFSFTIHVEARKAADNGGGLPQSAELPDFSGKRFMIVDDIEINREIAQELLKETGCEIETAENGKAAYDLFCASETGFYDVILMDMQMPVMDGCAATRKIRASARSDSGTVKIIAMTANVMEDDVKNALESGMNGHIAKPVDISAMYHVLKDIM